MRMLIPQRVWLNLLLLTLGFVLLMPWKLTPDLSVIHHISLPEAYALASLIIAVYFRRFICLPLKAIQGLCCLSFIMLVCFLLIYNKV
jgi:hypothetical protein